MSTATSTANASERSSTFDGEPTQHGGYTLIVVFFIVTFVVNAVWFVSGEQTGTRILAFGFNMLTAGTCIVLILRAIDGREQLRQIVAGIQREDAKPGHAVALPDWVTRGNLVVFVIVFAVIVWLLEQIAFPNAKDNSLEEAITGNLTPALLGGCIGAWVGYFWGTLSNLVSFFTTHRADLINKCDQLYPGGRGEVNYLARVTAKFVINNTILLSVPVVFGLLYSVLSSSVLVFACFFAGNVVVWGAIFYQYLRIRNAYLAVTEETRRATLHRLENAITAKFENVLNAKDGTALAVDEFNKLNTLYETMARTSDIPIEQIEKVKLALTLLATSGPILLKIFQTIRL